ncbi:hypothetical protein JW935_01400 [candidate division KSB1 bacterium]|nr:hypothetical protein [candidate division KSB1 bacterium]
MRFNFIPLRSAGRNRAASRRCGVLCGLRDPAERDHADLRHSGVLLRCLYEKYHGLSHINFEYTLCLAL